MAIKTKKNYLKITNPADKARNLSVLSINKTTKPLRIVIDMQAAQVALGSDRLRDYTLGLVQSLAANRGDHALFLVLNANLSPGPESMWCQFHGLIQKENILCWYPPWPTSPTDHNNQVRYACAERIREAFIGNLHPDVLVVTGFFSGYTQDYIASIGVLETKYPVVVVVSHIPNSSNEGLKRYVCKQLGQLRRARRIVVLPPLDRKTLVHQFSLADDQIIDGHDFAEGDLAQNNAQAKSLLMLFESISKDSASDPHDKISPKIRPRMAYVSPLPPEATGIADYSADLLPALASFYDIDVIVSQNKITDPWIVAHCKVRSVAWFKKNHQDYARVVYNFGNSPFHEHLFDILSQIPGVVILHDFFLGNLQFYRESYLRIPNTFSDALYSSHGYKAIIERYLIEDDSLVVGKYPANLKVIQQAKGVIVHSEHARDLASQWYGHHVGEAWKVLSLPRAAPVLEAGGGQAKLALGFKADDLLVCSFGMLGGTKLNHKLVEAWNSSVLASKCNAWLVFVGELPSGPYGEELQKQIKKSGCGQIKITGRVEQANYRQYLQAADVGVQLRAHSRGETSAAVLDCMNYGLPTIINANGSLKEIPSDAVIKLPDEFEADHLIYALESLMSEPKKRRELSIAAKREVEGQHSPEYCARLTAQAVECFYRTGGEGLQAVIDSLPEIPMTFDSDTEMAAFSSLLALNFPTHPAVKQLLIDVTITCHDDYKTGIQRVVRALTSELIKSPPAGYRVEPVFLKAQNNARSYRYARQWTAKSLSLPQLEWRDEPVEYNAGDQLLIADYTGGYAVETEREKCFEAIKRCGVSIHFVVYDLLPIHMPEVFPEGQFGFEDWVATVSRVADTALCISQSVADDLKAYVDRAKPDRINPIRIEWFHLGADMNNSIPTLGVPNDAGETLDLIKSRLSLLMVGTIEPRKGYMQAIEAFSLLWDQGIEVNLVIVGKEGWQALPDGMRRTIPSIVNRLRTHPQRGKRLIWLEGISDEYLEMVYVASSCLLAASEGEGFGLPLIEAAQKGLPVLARDIPVFREVAGEHASYFNGSDPAKLAEAVKAWLANPQRHQLAVKHNPMPWLTWPEATERLKAKLFEV
jgi:glycosyltransferase involved in cell wall biosynthesis